MIGSEQSARAAYEAWRGMQSPESPAPPWEELDPFNRSGWLNGVTPRVQPGCPCEWCERKRVEFAEKLYDAYNGALPNPWMSWNGGAVPRWSENTNLQVRAKWIAAACTALEETARG